MGRDGKSVNESNTVLELDFASAGDGVRLNRTVFRHPKLCDEHESRELVRVAAYNDGALRWSSALRSLCFLIVRTVLERRRGLTTFILRGREARTLFEVLRKRDSERQWVTDVFGYRCADREEDAAPPLLRTVFGHRGNTDDPSVWLAEEQLSVESIRIRCDGVDVVEVDALEELANSLDPSKSRNGDLITTEGIDARGGVFDLPPSPMSEERPSASTARLAASPLDLIDPRLKDVSYLSIARPIDVLRGDGPQLSISLLDEAFFLSPPRDVARAIRRAIREVDGLLPGDEGFGSRLAEYRARLRKEGTFATADTGCAARNMLESPSLRIARQVLGDDARIAAAKQKVFIDFLTMRAPARFHFNGPVFPVSSFRLTRDRDERPVFLIELQPSDYFTYCVMSEASDLIRHSGGLEALAKPGPFLEEYLADFQRCIHGTFGLAIVVHTLRDNRLVVTRRSSHAAHSAGEAGKYWLSANEGTSRKDLDPNRAGELNPIYKMVERALDEELIGSKKGTESLLAAVRTCVVTGVVLYLPNLSINLCVDVGIDSTAEDVRRSQRYARDGRFENWIVDEKRWDKVTGLPEYSISGLTKFIQESIGNRAPSETWDEGSLVAFALSTMWMRQ
jgi:hypothetical protein